MSPPPENDQIIISYQLTNKTLSDGDFLFVSNPVIDKERDDIIIT